ncbi:MAG: hypothetical protein H6739_38730 [Alphaproteobacteria bacterium]|nr:hypothetical protein [Alphaproteobacteria bacterium]
MTPDPTRHLSWDQLVAGFAALPPPPLREGRVALVTARLPEGARRTPARARLTVADGVEGDRWAQGRRMPEAQVTLMRADVAGLICNGQPLSLPGDNLLVELDLSLDNLPAGVRLAVGTAELEVTAEPHDGCTLFRERFGGPALKLTAHADYKALRLRGIHARVVRDGEVCPGDAVVVL